jgi:hypothetical protein
MGVAVIVRGGGDLGRSIVAGQGRQNESARHESSKSNGDA